VVAVRRDNARTVTITLDAATTAAPGQFAMLWLPWLDEKPFSLGGAEPLRFTIAAVGPFSRAIHMLGPGDPVWWRGPFGTGFKLRGAMPLLVGGGYGVAPMAFLAASGGASMRMRAIVGARTEEELLLADDLRAAGAEVMETTEDGSAGVKGLVTDAVRQLADDAAPDGLYACGPHGMLAALEAMAASLGVPAYLSWEAYMRCAIGICGSCEHNGRLLCADGPVLCTNGMNGAALWGGAAGGQW
jgi:dihydroorotate dehydrogenase electron transfer subunit